MQDKVGKHRKSFNKLTNSIFADGISLDEERIKNISLDDFKIFNKDSFPSIQIINKRVDPSKISNGYYQRLRYEIKKEIKKDTKIIFINFIPKKDIDEKWELETLLHLQKEFTNFIIIPPSSVDSNELKEWNDIFNPALMVRYNQ
jgi:hypothetical protein